MGHPHHHHNHQSIKGKKLGISILLNVLITVAQAVGGFATGSLSLLSDAMHNFSDVIALVISYIADILTHKAATAHQTYGYKRAEVLAAFVNAVSLIVLAAMLAREAISRFSNPIEINSLWVIILALAGIIVNGGSVILLHPEASENMNMKSAYLHLLMDMVASVAVLIGGFAMYWFQAYWVDSLLSILIAVYLVYSSAGLLLDTSKVLMQFAPDNVDSNAIRDSIMRFSIIENVHHMHIWQLNDKDIHLEAHIEFKEDLSLSHVTETIEKINQTIEERFNIHHIFLQPEIGTSHSKTLIADER